MKKSTIISSIPIVTLFFICVLGQSAPVPPNWSFNDSANWKNLYPECGWGQQSPIDIPRDTISACLDPLRIENLYWPQSNLLMQNDYRGAIILFDMESSYPLLVSGGPLPKNLWFHMRDLYFHVGADDRTGSEHTLQGVDYPMEIKADLTAYPGVDNVTAVLTFFVVVSAEDNQAWEPVIQGLSQIKRGGTSTTVSVASLAALLPPYSTWESKYYTYLGTWVTPPCQAKVVRVVYTTFIRLSDRQIHAFRLLQDENNRPITDNIRRPIPTLDYRAVFNTLPVY